MAHKLDNSLHCLSLATGVKCLPSNKVIQAQGLALHDSHAEILAIRGFNRFLIFSSIRLTADSSLTKLLESKTKKILINLPG